MAAFLERARTPIGRLLAAQLVMFTGVAAVFPIAPLYVTERGGNTIAVAVFIAGPLLANTIVQVPAGRLCDRYGRKPFLVGARVIYGALSFVLFAAAGPLWLLMAVRMVQGLAAGAYVPALRAALTDLSAPDERATRFSQLQAYEMVGLLIGPFIGGAAALWRDSAVFGFTGVSMYIGLIPLIRLPETRGASVSGANVRERFAWWRARGIVVPATGLFAVGTIWSMYDVIWPLYLSVRGNGPLVIGLSVSLFAVPILVLARPAGRLSDRTDRRVLITAALLIVAATTVSYPELRALAPILLVGFAESVATVIFEPSLFAIIGDSAPEAMRGRAMGVGGLFQFAGMAFGAAVLGSLYGVSERLPFWSGSGILLAAAVLSAVALPRGRVRSRAAEPQRAFPVLEREQA